MNMEDSCVYASDMMYHSLWQKVLIQLVGLVIWWHPTHTHTHTRPLPTTISSAAADQWQTRVCVWWTNGRLWTGLISPQRSNHLYLSEGRLNLGVFFHFPAIPPPARDIPHRAGLPSRRSDANSSNGSLTQIFAQQPLHLCHLSLMPPH